MNFRVTSGPVDRAVVAADAADVCGWSGMCAVCNKGFMVYRNGSDIIMYLDVRWWPKVVKRFTVVV